MFFVKHCGVLLSCLRAEKTPIEPDLGHASVGRHKERRRMSVRS